MLFYVYFGNAILWLMRIFASFISLVQFFGLIWLMRISANTNFPESKVALGKNPLYSVEIDTVMDLIFDTANI